MNSTNQTEILSTGRIENGFAAPYDFEISDIFNEAWARVKGFKTSLWGAIGCYVVVSIILSVIAASIGLMFDKDSPIMVVVRLIIQIVTYPLYAGILMMGIKRAVNLPVRAQLVFRYYNAIWRIIGVVLLSFAIAMVPSIIGGILIGIVVATSYSGIINLLLVLLGIAFIILGIYIVWSYIFAIQLTTEKRYGVWRSLEVSRKAVGQHWWKIFFMFLLLSFIYFLSVICLFVGLIWTLPLVVISQGVLYRRIFGVEPDLITNE